MKTHHKSARFSRMGWVPHVVVDAALGIGLLIAGIHGHGTDYLLLDLAGGYLVVLTILTKGPGGLWKVVPRVAHRVLDGVVSLALIASPFIVWSSHVHLDVFATAMAEAVGVILLRGALVSDHRDSPARAARTVRSGATGPIETRAFESGSGSGPSAGRDVDGTARRLGRASANVANQMPDAARRAGVVAGRTRRAAQAARANRASRQREAGNR